MARYERMIAIVLLFCFARCGADTFTDHETGDVFHGFATQKQVQNKVLVWNAEAEKFQQIELANYDVKRGYNGRRDNVAIVTLDSEEIMLSQAVSRAVEKVIVDASNKGPRFILLEIDSPGGGGDYMKIISTAITKTKNCPVVAFIKAENYGGAYSCAAVLAMACDKIYMAPDAVIGAVAPAVGRAMTDVEIKDYIATFSGPNLAMYKSYIATLAEKNARPGTVAMAILDKNLEVIEVADREGNRSFITDRSERATDQVVVRNWTKPDGSTALADATAVVDMKTTVLTLASNDAVKIKMADKIADSQTAILKDMGAGEAKLVGNRQIAEAIRKFAANKRTVNRFLVQIEQMQERADEVSNALRQAEEKNRANTATREYQTAERDDHDVNVRSRTQFGNPPKRRPQRKQYSESVVETEQINERPLRGELMGILSDLIRNYRRVIGLVQRFPGTLPSGMSLQSLENGMNKAMAAQNELKRSVTRKGGAETGNWPVTR